MGFFFVAISLEKNYVIDWATCSAGKFRTAMVSLVPAMPAIFPEGTRIHAIHNWKNAI
jgi:hypothetical protein